MYRIMNAKMKYMNLALNEAKKAFFNNEVPVGAIIVKNNEIIAFAHNTKIKNNNIFNHAEILAIVEATNKLGDWRLTDCEMYVTLEPCPMCAGAIVQSRIKKIYIGTSSNVCCNREVIKKILQNDEYYHYVECEYLNNKECSEILSNFFANKR